MRRRPGAGERIVGGRSGWPPRRPCAAISCRLRGAMLYHRVPPHGAPPSARSTSRCRTTQPQAEGLYDPRYEHDACGVAMVARLDNEPTHEVVEKAPARAGQPRAPRRRGRRPAHRRRRRASSSSCPTSSSARSCDFELPPAGQYGVGVCFLPQDETRRGKLEELLELNVRVEGQRVLGWRDVPDRRGARRRDRQPHAARTCGSSSSAPATGLQRRPGRLRAQALRDPPRSSSSPPARTSTPPSFSSRTIVYKGMLIAHQVARLLPRPAATSASRARMALVHSRFSTNTFPSWELAHPYRVIAHNGEINTLMGNVNWMRARESPARLRALRPRPARRSCRSSAPAARTRRRSTTSSSC